MVRTYLILLILLGIPAVLLFAQTQSSRPVLMPVPKSMKVHPGRFIIRKSFKISEPDVVCIRVNESVHRFRARLEKITGISFNDKTKTAHNKTVALRIRCEPTGKLVLGTDESYHLRITEKAIELNAKTDLGAMHGLETLLQLLVKDKNKYYFPCVEIDDAPRFVWRGLMIDCARHFMPLEVLKRNIDGMTAMKLNVFHWHLSDDQGFRVESQTFPALHETASNGKYYTHQDIRSIITYANVRGIRVVPEFDIPGHSTSWLAAFPQYGSAPGTGKPETGYGTFDPTFNPTNDSVYTFFDAFFAEISTLFDDEYIHIGGDENNGLQWKNNTDIQHFMKEHGIPDNHALQAYFNKRINAILTAHGKKMMGWDEILHPDLPKNIVVHSWRGMQYLKDAAKKGYSNVLSNGYYIDLYYPAKDHYLVDPCPDSLGLSPEEQSHILGGEATMWSEWVTPENIDSRIWPRTAAIAERLWSQASVRDVDDMYDRLNTISLYLDGLGLKHIRNSDVMLQQLATSQDFTPLKALAGLLEPIKGYDRYNYNAYTTSSQFNRVVDAISPESEAARQFGKMVDAFIAGDRLLGSKLIDKLKTWDQNHEKFSKLQENAPVIAEIVPASSELQKLALLGMEAVSYIDKNVKPDAAWQQRTAEVLAGCGKPIAETKLAVVDAVKKLVSAAGK